MFDVSAIADGYARGCAVWPTVQLSPIGFASHVRAVAGEETGAALDGLRFEDLFLAAACSAGDREALRVFEASYFGELERAFRSLARDGRVADDARQNLREQLFVHRADRPAEIARYAGRGSLRTWFRIVVYHHTLNFKQRDRAAPAGAALADGVAVDPEILYLRELYASEFRAATEDAIDGLAAGDRAFLQHHYVERLTIDQLAMIYGLHRVTVARRITKARASLVAQIRARLQARLRVEACELDSILRLLPSVMRLSLSRLLAGPGAAPALP
jgi:RNA polymerase sigma-70 factor (ECF subfamily)